MHSVPETPLFFRARRIGDGQTFELFRRFYFRIFGGNLICPSLVYYISHTFPTISMGCGSWKPFAAETARRWDQLSPCVSWVRCKVASSQFE